MEIWREPEPEPMEAPSWFKDKYRGADITPAEIQKAWERERKTRYNRQVEEKKKLRALWGRAAGQVPAAQPRIPRLPPAISRPTRARPAAGPAARRARPAPRAAKAGLAAGGFLQKGVVYTIPLKVLRCLPDCPLGIFG
jgi:hypothetical protein